MSLASVIQGIGDKTKGEVYTMTIGRIEEVDRRYNRASKVLLLDEEQESKYNDVDSAYIYNIPFVSYSTSEFVMIPPFQKGDYVVVLFSHRDIDNILENSGSEGDGSGIFDKSDAVIVGGVNLFDAPITEPSNDGDFTIAKRDGSLRINIDKESNIEIQTDGKIYLGDKDDAEAVPLGEQLKEWLDNHTHDYDWSSTGGSGVTEPPKQKSPDLSKRVYNA